MPGLGFMEGTRLSQDVVSARKMDQKGSEKPGNNTKIPCAHVYSIVQCFAPHAWKTLMLFPPFFICLLKNCDIFQISVFVGSFFPRFYVDYAVPTEEPLGSTDPTDGPAVSTLRVVWGSTKHACGMHWGNSPFGIENLGRFGFGMMGG